MSGIDIDVEAKALADTAQMVFAKEEEFSPQMIFYRNGEILASAIMRSFDGDDDKRMAFTELATLAVVLRAEEACVAFDAWTSAAPNVRPSDAPDRQEAINCIFANASGCSIRIFPYTRNEEGRVCDWGEVIRPTNADSVDGFVTPTMMAFLGENRRPYLSTAYITTLVKRGHLVHLFVPESTLEQAI